MKKVLIIDWAIGRSETIKRLLEVYKASDTFIATDEWEARNHLKNNKIDIIIIDPVLGPEALDDECEKTPRIEVGETGFLLIKNLQLGVLKTYPVQPKIILLTKVDLADLEQVGFLGISYLKKPANIRDIVSEIKKK
jgi:DNA-binding response OmpR family regulator